MRRKHAILLTLWLAVGVVGWLMLAPSLQVARSASKVFATPPGESAAPPERFEPPVAFRQPAPNEPAPAKPTAPAGGIAAVENTAAPSAPPAPAPSPPATAPTADAPTAVNGNSQSLNAWLLTGSGKGGGGTGGGGFGLGSIATIGKGGGAGGSGFGSGVKKNANAASAAPRAATPEPITPQTIDDILAALPIGSIAFNTPEEIPLGESAVIELLLSMTEPEASLAGGVRGPGPVETARVRFGNLMQAELSGLGFDIEPITPEQQAVSQSERTRWKWQIRPTETDAQPLHLTLSAQVRVDGERLARTIETFEREIRVRVPLVRRVTDFVSGHSEMFFSLLLAPLAAAGWKRWRSQRTKRLASEAAEAASAPESPAKHAA